MGQQMAWVEAELVCVGTEAIRGGGWGMFWKGRSRAPLHPRLFFLPATNWPPCWVPPLLVVQGVGECIATLSVPKVRGSVVCSMLSSPATEHPNTVYRHATHKSSACMPCTHPHTAQLFTRQIFLLNGAIDRETSCCGPEGRPMTAADMVQAAAGALARACCGCWKGIS